MIKPVACPRCGTVPEIKELMFGGFDVICMKDVKRCGSNAKSGQICQWLGTFRTRLGAILRWNWQCFWENRRMRRKAK